MWSNQAYISCLSKHSILCPYLDCCTFEDGRVRLYVLGRTPFIFRYASSGQVSPQHPKAWSFAYGDRPGNPVRQRPGYAFVEYHLRQSSRGLQVTSGLEAIEIQPAANALMPGNTISGEKETRRLCAYLWDFGDLQIEG